MTVDDRALHGLIVESQDLQADALRDMKGKLSDAAELSHDRGRASLDPDTIQSFNEGRRSALRNGGLGMGAFAARGLVAGGIGAALTGILAAPASAQDGGMDVQILQTAASLENLAVATYGAALGLDFIKSGNAVVKKFAETTMKQHDEHADAFNAMAKTLKGAEQKDTKALMASVMGVESQHLATLRAVAALLAGGDAGAALIAIPTNVAKLPAAAGSVAFPKPFEPTDMASPPEEGAVK